MDTPDDNGMFRGNIQVNAGVDAVSTGGGRSRKPTPEERLDKVEENVERIGTVDFFQE